MKEFQQQLALRIFTDETARGERRPLFEEILDKARAARLAGATVVTGTLGFGHSRLLHTDKILRLSFDRPLVIEIIDTIEKVRAFLPTLAPYSNCLITLADVMARRPQSLSS